MSNTVKEEPEDDLISRKVSMTVFSWVMGLVCTLFSLGMIYTMNAAASAERRAVSAEAKVDTLKESIQPLHIAIGQIQTNLEWIRRDIAAISTRQEQQATSGRR